MIEELLKLADMLDERGLTKEADYVDGLIKVAYNPPQGQVMTQGVGGVQVPAMGRNLWNQTIGRTGVMQFDPKTGKPFSPALRDVRQMGQQAWTNPAAAQARGNVAQNLQKNAPYNKPAPQQNTVYNPATGQQSINLPD